MKALSVCSHRFTLTLLAGFIFSIVSFAADEKPANKKYEGTLETGIMAIGGETTGFILMTKNEGNYELDLSKCPKLNESTEALNGKAVIVHGEYKPRAGVEIRERRILIVTSLEAAK